MYSFNARTLFRAWCHLAPFAVVQAALGSELSPAPDSSPDPQPDSIPQLNPQPDPEPQLIPEPDHFPGVDLFIIPVVPPIMGWLGSIGGVLGIISFTEHYITRLVKAIKGPPKPPPPPASVEVHDYDFWKKIEDKHYRYVASRPKKDGDPPWMVAIQVGLDGAGLQGAGGEFPQICLWNRHGELIGYNDQTIHFIDKTLDRAREYNFESSRQDMPEILNGGLKTVGIWPAPGHEDLREQQATYVTMVKRHFDAICVASVFLKWFDDQTWLFDGTWAQSSNMSWYYSYIFGSGRKDDGACFWLDHRGDLKHTKDLEEEYIGASLDDLGRKPREDYPDYLWAANVLPETGIPEGDKLTDGMRENGVHKYKVPLGVKFHAPAFVAGSYDYDNFTVSDFVDNPGKLRWIMEPTRENVRGGNPVLPILHPRADLSDRNPELVWEDASKQDIPIDCMTDWYYDANGKLVEPGADRRCTFMQRGPPKRCRDKWRPKNPRALDKDTGANLPVLPLHERHARTLVNDQNHRSDGSSTKKLCESPDLVGPSYANHRERFFCRMTDKTLWPFCDSAVGISHDCFDAEAEILVEKNKPLGKRAHHWDSIEDWHSGERFKRAA